MLHVFMKILHFYEQIWPTNVFWKENFCWKFTQLKSRVGFGMGFFCDPESRSRVFGIGIFNFGLDRKISKIQKSPGSGPRFQDLGKIPSAKFRKSRNPGDQDRDLKNHEKNPRVLGVFLISGFLSLGFMQISCIEKNFSLNFSIIFEQFKWGFIFKI